MWGAGRLSLAKNDAERSDLWREAVETCSGKVQLVTAVGLIFVCFGPAYTRILLQLLYGAAWTSTEATTNNPNRTTVTRNLTPGHFGGTDGAGVVLPLRAIHGSEWAHRGRTDDRSRHTISDIRYPHPRPMCTPLPRRGS